MSETPPEGRDPQQPEQPPVEYPTVEQPRWDPSATQVQPPAEYPPPPAAQPGPPPEYQQSGYEQGQPQYGQAYGQPQYGQPGYSQPQYGQGYQQGQYPPPGYPAYGTPPAYQAPRPTKPTNGLAVAAMIVGIVGIVAFWVPFLGIILAATALTLGIVSLRKRLAGHSGRGMGIAGVILGGVGLVVSILATIAILYVWDDIDDCFNGNLTKQQQEDCIRDRINDRIDRVDRGPVY